MNPSMNGYWVVVLLGSSTTPTTRLTSIAEECPETSVNRPLHSAPPDQHPCDDLAECGEDDNAGKIVMPH